MYSFDIFDTLITRNTETPQGVFLLMQEYIQEKKEEYGRYSVLKDFACLRIEAEENASANTGKAVICLQDIYNTLAKKVCLSREDTERLMLLEVQTEIRCAVGIEKNIQKIIDLFDSNKHVVLISDMYLSEEDIRNILINVHPIFTRIPIYVSSEHACTKQDGLLYIKVKESESASYGNWTHYGDNYISDICIPNILGIKTVYIEPCPLFSWEKEMINELGLAGNLPLEIAFGAIRRVRMRNSLKCKEELGVSIGGIILFPYVEWIINQAIQLGIRRLYFVARDGYILKKIADIYIKKNNLAVSTKYIYGSRLAWRVEEKVKREDVLKYLQQEVDFKDKNFAFVDLQGTGLSMKYLSEILKGCFNERLKIFYYNMVEKFENPLCDYMVYSDCDSYLIEVLCRAPHGVTIGYERNNGRYIPCLAETDIQRWKDCGLPDYIRGIELFTEEIVNIALRLGCKIKIKKMGEFLLDHCNKTKDSMILDFIGEIPHSSYGLHDSKAYAPKLSQKQIFQIFMWRTSERIDEYYQGENYEYSLLRMSPWEYKFVNFYERNYNKLLGKVIHMYKRIILKECRWRFVPKKRIIIYAAGKVGKELYCELRYLIGIRVIGWTDMDYMKYQDLGYPVKPLRELIDLKYDVVVIAIKDKEKVRKVKYLLAEAGIRPDCIMDKEEFLEKCL